MERTITPQDFATIADTALVLDVRRKEDREASHEMVEWSFWKDPERIDEWMSAVPRIHDVVIYCVRGGSVSKSVHEALTAKGFEVQYMEGGLAAWDAAPK